MFPHSSLLLTVAISTASAQYADNNTLGSCVDVDCPSANGNTTLAECQITNRTYGLIGLESFSTSITDNQDNLTWTVGTHVYEKPDPNESLSRNIEKDFYLGTPPSLDLTADDFPYHGCAIFLYGNDLVRPKKESQQCGDVISTECLDSLLKDASALLVDSQEETESAEDACQRVQMGLNESFSSGCKKVSGQEKWNHIKAVALTGDGAPAPPSQSANESSTCHPTLPKSNDLSFVFGYNDTGTARSNSTIPMFYAVNLVLTLFWSPNNTAEGALADPESHLSCLWPVDMNKEQLENEKPNGAWRMECSSALASFVAIAVAMLVLI